LLVSQLAVSEFVPTVKAQGWLTGWTYRKSHIINGASGAGTNYQMRIVAHYGSGTDSGQDVYLNSHSKTDFGDVRFTKSDGVTLLDYYMENIIYTPTGEEDVVFQEGWENFTGTANDDVTDNWAGWTEAPVNGGIDDARTGAVVGTYCIALRPSGPAPTSSYGRIYTESTYEIKDKVKFWIKRNEAGSNSWAKFKLLNADNTTRAEWSLTLYNSWTEVTIDVSAYKGEFLRFCLEAGTNVNGYGYATLFDDFRHIKAYYTTSAVFWVEVADDLSSSNVTIYVYYGKSDATTTSNGVNTFVFFDDFESYADGSDINNQGGWITKTVGSGGEAKVRVKNGRKHLHLSSSASSAPHATAVIHPASTSNSGYAIRLYEYADDWNEAFSMAFSDDTVTSEGNVNNGYEAIWWGWAGATSKIRKWSGGTSTDLASISDSDANNVYHILEFTWFGSSLKAFRDGTSKMSASDTTYTSRTYIHLDEWSGSSRYTDWVLVRKFVDPEPSHGSWGSEETSGQTYTVDTTFQTTPTWTLPTQATFNIAPSWNLEESFAVLTQSVFNVQPQWTLTESLNILTASTFNILPQWNIQTGWNMLTETLFNVQPQWTLSESWNILTTSVFNVLPQWGLSETFTVLTQSFFNVIPQWSFQESWNTLTTSVFNIVSGWTSNLQWTLEVLKFTGAQFYTVDLTWLTQTTWETLTTNTFNVVNTWSLNPTWTVLTQTTYNVLSSWQTSASWTLDVYHWISTGITYYVDLTWQTAIEWFTEIQILPPSGTPWISPTPQPPSELPPVYVPPETVPLINIGLITIAVIVGVYLYSQLATPKTVDDKTVEDKWKQKRAQSNSAQWKRTQLNSVQWKRRQSKSAQWKRKQAKPVKWKKKSRFEE